MGTQAAGRRDPRAFVSGMLAAHGAGAAGGRVMKAFNALMTWLLAVFKRRERE